MSDPPFVELWAGAAPELDSMIAWINLHDNEGNTNKGCLRDKARTTEPYRETINPSCKLLRWSPNGCPKLLAKLFTGTVKAGRSPGILWNWYMYIGVSILVMGHLGTAFGARILLNSRLKLICAHHSANKSVLHWGKVFFGGWRYFVKLDFCFNPIHVDLRVPEWALVDNFDALY